MADSVLFEVDASQILAKLHLAGIQATKIGPESFIINTGIVNDNPSAKPDKPGNVSFELKNSSGEYEVGYATWIEYHKSYDLDDSLSKLQKLQADLSGEKSKLDDKSSDPKVKKALEDLEKYKEKVRKSVGFKDDVHLDTPEDIKKAKDAAKEVISNDESGYNKAVEEKKTEAVKALTSYLNNFAGADNVEKFTDAALIPITEKAKDSNDASLVKLFEIQKAPDQEVEKLVAQFKANFDKDPKKPNCRQHVCFKVKYSLNIDK